MRVLLRQLSAGVNPSGKASTYQVCLAGPPTTVESDVLTNSHSVGRVSYTRYKAPGFIESALVDIIDVNVYWMILGELKRRWWQSG